MTDEEIEKLIEHLDRGANQIVRTNEGFQICIHDEDKENAAKALRQLLQERKWRPIEEEMKGGPWVVTNNIHARLNNGAMSHVWVTNFIQWDAKAEEFICFEGFRKVKGLKFFAPIPLPYSPRVAE